jgi:hypothetical protein
LADESSAVTTAAPPQATNAATPGVRATAASLEPSLPAPIRLKSTAEHCVMGAPKCPCGGGMRTASVLYCDGCGASRCHECRADVGPDGYCDPCASAASAPEPALPSEAEDAVAWCATCGKTWAEPFLWFLGVDSVLFAHRMRHCLLTGAFPFDPLSCLSGPVEAGA